MITDDIDAFLAFAGRLPAERPATARGAFLVAPEGFALASESALLACHDALGGELTRIALARAEPLGKETGWKPARPITQWVWTRP